MNAKRAAVRPRVSAPAAGGSVPLEDEVIAAIESGGEPVIGVIGTAGSGKTTAIEHLAALLPADSGVVLLDNPTPDELNRHAGARLVVFTAATYSPLAKRRNNLWLAPWGADEAIEYLLAVHRERTAENRPILKTIRQVRVRIVATATGH
jgi:energy-coupling factor transporter ATP-binding protein EcfA2